MTTTATIRQAAPQDAFAVAALHLQCARAAGAGPDPTFLDRWADAWLPEHATRPHWLVEVLGRPVAVAGLHLLTDLPAPGRTQTRWAAGSALFVAPSLRRCGIGGQLARAVAAWARAEGLDRIVADTALLGDAGPGIARRLGSRQPDIALLGARCRPAG